MINNVLNESMNELIATQDIEIVNEVIDLSNIVSVLVIGVAFVIIAILHLKYKSNIKTVNVDKTKEGYILVDRKTVLGNPFKLEDFTYTKCLKYYEGYLHYMIHVKKDKDIIDGINKLYNKSKAGKIKLGCHCKPLPCHSDIIAKFVRNMSKEL